MLIANNPLKHYFKLPVILHQLHVFMRASIQFDTISTNVISSKKGILRSELRSSIPTGKCVYRMRGDFAGCKARSFGNTLS